jgi:hypothetical protein
LSQGGVRAQPWFRRLEHCRETRLFAAFAYRLMPFHASAALPILFIATQNGVN